MTEATRPSNKGRLTSVKTSPIFSIYKVGRFARANIELLSRM